MSNHPEHYNKHPSGIECIDIAQHFNFNIGNIIKYAWRVGLKEGEDSIKELEKIINYANFEINRLQNENYASSQVIITDNED